MRKQVLFIAIFAILLAGCNAQQQTNDQNVMEDENVSPVVEETTETPVLNEGSDEKELVDTLKDIESERMESKKLQEEQEAAANDQIQKDLDLLGSFKGEPTESDCNKIITPDIKSACLELLEG